jgi:hypothetical protein
MFQFNKPSSGVTLQKLKKKKKYTCSMHYWLVRSHLFKYLLKYTTFVALSKIRHVFRVKNHHGCVFYLDYSSGEINIPYIHNCLVPAHIQ